MIIDEVSMVSAKLLKVIHQRLNQIFETPDGCFGQRAVILVGDYYQLRPVAGQFVFENTKFMRYQTGFHLYCSLFYPVFLSLPQRQCEDESWAHILNRIRIYQPTPLDLQVLHQ